MIYQKQRKRPKLGDIIEIKTDKGLAYVQYTYKLKRYGYLIRVLPDLFSTRLEDFISITSKKERFFTFFALGAATNQELMEIVANEYIPEKSQGMPLMRAAGYIELNGEVRDWWLRDGEKEWRIGKLAENELRLSVFEWPSFSVLKNRIENNWKPEDYS